MGTGSDVGHSGVRLLLANQGNLSKKLTIQKLIYESLSEIN